MANGADECRINLSPCAGVAFVEVLTTNPEYFDEIRIGGAIWANHVGDIVSHPEFAKYLEREYPTNDMREVGDEMEVGEARNRNGGMRNLRSCTGEEELGRLGSRDLNFQSRCDLLGSIR